MKLLMLNKYAWQGASSRLRSLQYTRHFANAGISVEGAPLFDDDYVRDLNAGARTRFPPVVSYAKRAMRLMRAQTDAIWLEYEALPWIPLSIERALLPSLASLVVDYDDAIFHRYDLHRSAIVRKALGGKIDGVMRRADLVFAGNDYLASRARAAGCRRVEILPTVVDLERYPREQRSGRSEPVVVGWMGSFSTAPYLQAIAEVAWDLRRTLGLRFVAVGARASQLEGTPFEAAEWREEGEVAQLRGFDIGIMPLIDGPWERGKCGYKLIQYMASSLPVVASPIGVNCSLIRQGENGFLASSAEEWKQALMRLAKDAELRARMGVVGRAVVESYYSVQIQAPRVIRLLQELTSRGAG